MDLDLGLSFDCPSASDLTNPHLPKDDVWCFNCKKTMKQGKAHNVRTVHGIVFKCKACAPPVKETVRLPSQEEMQYLFNVCR
jgi:hypothetical protein